MWRRLFSQFSSHPSRGNARRRAKPHRFSGRRPTHFGAEQLEARWYLSGDPIVQVNTNFGNFQIELLPSAAPQSVANFLSYVNSGAYTNTFFHRSEQPSVSVPNDIGIIQAGGFSSASPTYTSVSQFQTIPTQAPIPLEYNLPNATGTVAMARLGGSNTATATDQFFINDIDNSTSLGQSNGGGYAVFGKIDAAGMQVVNKIAALSTIQADPTNQNSAFNQLPLGASNQLVQITSMTLLDGVYGTIFTDANANGKQDSGEAGVAGRTVFVDVDGTGQLNSNPSATTDANGNYTIAAVPAGNFKVVEVLPSGVHPTATLQTVAFAASTAAAKVNFGEGPAIVGTVFNDLNGNGKQDSGEAGISGRTVFVDVDGTGQLNSNPKATTDASGNYSIAAVPAGNFKVEEVLPSGVHATTTLQTITFAANSAPAKVSFGEGPAIVGTVFTDLNANGKLDPSDPVVSGRTVFLNVDNTGQLNNNPKTTTDANGRFSFFGLAADTYDVREVAPSGVTLGTNTQSIVVAQNQPPATANLGELPSIIGTVFNDLNVNGKLDANEPGMAGVTVFLNNDNSGKPDSQNPSTTTDAAGHFYFIGLASGPYNVMQVVTADHGVTQTTTTSAVTVGSSLPNVVIGNALTSPLVPLPVNVNTQTPPSDATQAYIDSLYFTLLGHHADAKSLSDWQQQMNAGTTRAAVAQAIWDSPEHRGLEVDQFYHTYLDRAPEADGRKFWVDRFASGNLTERLAVSFFLSSKEYQDAHSANADYISALYQDVLSRTASSSDQSYWNTAMSGGQTRDQVAVSLVNGGEAATKIIDAYYANFLHRAAGSGSQDLVNTLVAGQTTAEGAGVGILATDEYFALAGGK